MSTIPECCAALMRAADRDDHDYVRCSCGRTWELAVVPALAWKEVLA